MAIKHPGIRPKIFIINAVLLFAIICVFGLSYAADVSGRSAYEQELLKCINRHRINDGSAPLSFDETLGKIARNHSSNMDKNSELDHDDFDDSFRRCGRACCVENIGWNYVTPEAQFKAWKNSTDHNRNILNKQIRHAGISKVGAYVTFFACD